ncbi:MAG: SpoIIE family protein phosphatase, partial [Leptospirales bacterium]
KSMQGAGGVLVLGAAFQAIIDRTLAMTYMDAADAAEHYPEMWMESTYRQLHAIFESFDGSMLVSIALGLIEDDTGMLYYLNAEHPWTAIYEKGAARFIEEDVNFRKLGTPDTNQGFRILTRRLEPGSILIAGSDGRDDILISRAGGGTAALLDDESQFLRFIEEGEGDLDAIKSAMLRRGELTDDLSLLRVEYVGSPANHETSGRNAQDTEIRDALLQARELQAARDLPRAVAVLEQGLKNFTTPERVRLLRELIKCRMQLKDYPAAARDAREYLEQAPQDTDMLVLGVHLHKQAREFETALHLAGRAFIRNPGVVRNLLYLAELHGRARDFERAAFFLRNVKELAPDHPRIQKIEKYLESRRLAHDRLELSERIPPRDLRHAAGSHH